MARFKVIVSGVVQGVGFRPFIYQLATHYKLTGNVCNTSGTVDIEVQGDIDIINDFILDIRKKAPPASTGSRVKPYLSASMNSCRVILPMPSMKNFSL